MTITLYLQNKTLLRDLETLRIIFQYKPEAFNELREYYKPLNISSSEFTIGNICIQVTPEEFALIGIFNQGI